MYLIHIYFLKKFKYLSIISNNNLGISRNPYLPKDLKKMFFDKGRHPMFKSVISCEMCTWFQKAIENNFFINFQFKSVLLVQTWNNVKLIKLLNMKIFKYLMGSYTIYLYYKKTGNG